jgi:predicted Zn-dependent protease
MSSRCRFAVVVLCGLCGPGVGAAATGGPVENFVEAKLLATEGRYAEAIQAFEQAVQGEPREAYLRLEYARLLLRLGNLTGAAQQAEAGFRAAPGNLDVLRMLAEVRVAQASVDRSQIGAARAALAALLASSPGEPAASMTLAQLALAAGDAVEATNVLAAARKVRPRNPALAGAYVESLRRLPGVDLEAKLRAGLEAEPDVLELRFALADELSERLEVAAALEILLAAPPQQQGEPEFLRRTALAHYRDADVARALAILELPAGHDEEPTSTLLRATLLSGAGSFAAAEAALRRLDLESGTGLSDEAVLALARAIAMQGRLAEAGGAIAAQRRALAASGEAEAAREVAFRFAAFAAGQRQWDLAEEVLNDRPAASEVADEELDLLAECWIARGDPRRAVARLAERAAVPRLAARRAEALWRLGRRREATRELTSLAAKGVEEAIEAGQAWQRVDQYSEALRVARGVLAQQPQHLASRFLEASSLERLGSLEEAKRGFRSLLAQHPTFAPALNYLAYAIADAAAADTADTAELEAARIMARRAVAADPANPAYLDTLAWVYFRLGQPAAAQPLLERAALLLPADATVWDHLGDVRRVRGDLRGARSAYQESLRRGRDDPEGSSADRAERKRKLRALGRERS